MKRRLLFRSSFLAILAAVLILAQPHLDARRALTVTVRAEIGGSQTKIGDRGTATFPFGVNGNVDLTDGVAANQANLLFSDTRTLTASGTEDLDLAGVLADIYGTTLTMVKIKAIIVKAASANTNNVVVSRPASNGVPLFSAASDAIPVLPGGAFMWVAPNLAAITVTAGTGDLITFTNSAGSTSVTYDVIILGTSS